MSVAVLLLGKDVNDQAKVSGSRSASLDALPSNTTVAPISTL